MSYATYLRNKTVSAPKITSLHKPTDASQHTHKVRLFSHQTFFADGKGVGSLAMDTTRPTGIPLLQHVSRSYAKGSTRPTDASDYTAFRGHVGVNNDSKYLGGGKVTTQTCCQIPEVDSSKYKSASDGLRSEILKKCIETDTFNTLRDPPRFVDNTIRLSAMVPSMMGDGCVNAPLVAANHTHSPGLTIGNQRQDFAVTQHTFMAAPPGFQNQGVGGARIGAYYTPKSGYVENKHGNDLNVNPRRIPIPWVYSPGAPAHLKINRPTLFRIKPSF